MSPRKLALVSTLLVCLSTLLSSGCSSKMQLQAPPPDSAEQKQLPFQAASDTAGVTPTGALTPSGVPVGTPVIVHFRDPLSSASAHAGDLFEAVLDESIMVRGLTVVPRGSVLQGKVVEAKGAGRVDGPGYLRLTLIEISLQGKSLELKVSSVFRKGSPRMRTISGVEPDLGHSSRDAVFPAGKRVTFRLAQTLAVSS